MIGKILLALVAAFSLGFMTTGCASHSETNPMANANGDIIDVATGQGMEQVTTLVQAVKAAGLVETLKGTGPFTVFAPTNEAFAKLPAGTLDNLLKPENREQLRKILLFHVVIGRHDAAELAGMKTLKTVEGGTLNISESDHRLTVGNSKATATIIRSDINASNGVIHWVDTVLMPE